MLQIPYLWLSGRTLCHAINSWLNNERSILFNVAFNVKSLLTTSTSYENHPWSQKRKEKITELTVTVLNVIVRKRSHFLEWMSKSFHFAVTRTAPVTQRLSCSSRLVKLMNSDIKFDKLDMTASGSTNCQCVDMNEYFISKYILPYTHLKMAKLELR